MGRLVVVEGLDGAGKRTLTDALTRALHDKGATVGALAFPRYEVDIHAQLVRDALHGGLGDLGDSVHGMAVLYALDRLGAREQLIADAGRYDVLLVDRYIASNAAYGAARLRQDANGEFVRWLAELEVGRFDLPVPDLHLLLRVPVDVAAERAARREAADPGRLRDRYESDSALQVRCGLVYDQLAATGWLAPWEVLDGAGGTDAGQLAVRLLELDPRTP
ncbi:MAG TPA: dTMP kinase [Pseudonocardiaceae bacterium]|nr:dTMP kinase [Pseudonocardiaceae bacterium]